MVLANIFREEGREEGIERGRKESQARIEELQKYIKELEAANDQNGKNDKPQG